MKKFKLYYISLEDLTMEIQDKCEHIKIMSEYAFIYTDKKIKGLIGADEDLVKDVKDSLEEWLTICQMSSLNSASNSKKSKEIIEKFENDFRAELDKAITEERNKETKVQDFPNLKDKGFTC